MTNQIKSIQPLQPWFQEQETESAAPLSAPSFLDVFKSIAGQAVETQQIRAQDMLDLMLGDVDDIERVQTNIYKAQTAMELLTNVRNVTLEAYNEIIKMSI
ncbi:MAG: flagellar hook-basal body complex protein FliE [Oscillospiraceae bacterium]|nr:flagellar hook-basal body complex protein FliE [Oscillospiraceae bacterium]